MKNFSKLFGIIACVAIIGLSFVGCGGTTSSSYFTFDSAKGIITGYSGEGPKNVNIPSKIKGTPVVYIYSSALSGKQLVSITIPNSITEIGLDEIISGNRETLTSITIGANTKVLRWHAGGFWGDWDRNGRQAGTYLLSDNVWTKK